MKSYNKKGLYNSYDKNHKERDKLDYYATPPKEVLNILTLLDLDFSNCVILEPCCGGGHMVQAIEEYLKNKSSVANIIATDIHKHGEEDYLIGEQYDFLSDDYPFRGADWVIMNPPYSTIEPFVIRASEIATRGIIMLGRLQFLEGRKRYDNIFSNFPPTEVYVYIDRIKCWKDGVDDGTSSAQAYAWFVWDKEKVNEGTKIKWIHRVP